MPFLRFLLALLVCIAVWAIGLRLSPWFPWWVDPFLVLVIYVGLRAAPVWGMVAGSITGLIADAMSGGTYGLFGFANTMVAAASDRLRRRLVAQDTLRLGLIFALAAALQQVVVAGLQFFVLASLPLPSPLMVAGKVLSTAVLGTVAIAVTEWASRAYHQWREARRRRLAIDTR
ncbi:MAG: rod shape-determining protein MreD [Acidobacteriota bacterium]